MCPPIWESRPARIALIIREHPRVLPYGMDGFRSTTYGVSLPPTLVYDDGFRVSTVLTPPNVHSNS